MMRFVSGPTTYLVRGISRSNDHAALQLDLHAEFELDVIYQEWLDVSLHQAPRAFCGPAPLFE